jgi:hypothetical protein
VSNNTALCLFEDADKNLWVGLDNGITVLTSVSIHNFIDNTGVLGTVYSSKLYNGNYILEPIKDYFIKISRATSLLNLYQAKGRFGPV